MEPEQAISNAERKAANSDSLAEQLNKAGFSSKKIVFNKSPLPRETSSYLLLMDYQRKCTNDRRNPFWNRILHDGFITQADKDNVIATREFWKNEYLPLYMEECRKKGLPILA